MFYIIPDYYVQYVMSHYKNDKNLKLPYYTRICIHTALYIDIDYKSINEPICLQIFDQYETMLNDQMSCFEVDLSMC